MAAVHISRAEAANSFDALIGQAGRGDEVVIEDAFPVIMKRAVAQPGRLLSDMIAAAEYRGSTVKLDKDFGSDLEKVISGHPQPFDPPAWD